MLFAPISDLSCDGHCVDCSPSLPTPHTHSAHPCTPAVPQGLVCMPPGPLAGSLALASGWVQPMGGRRSEVGLFTPVPSLLDHSTCWGPLTTAASAWFDRFALGGSSGFPESPVHSLNPVHTGAHSPFLNSYLPLGVPAASSRPLLTQRLRKGMKLPDTFSVNLHSLVQSPREATSTAKPVK